MGYIVGGTPRGAAECLEKRRGPARKSRWANRAENPAAYGQQLFGGGDWAVVPLLQQRFLQESVPQPAIMGMRSRKEKSISRFMFGSRFVEIITIGASNQS